jgi:hypothetical protein
MRIPLSVKIRSFFARDKDEFWWNHFTDEEKELRRMDVWQLAKVINEGRVRNLAGEAEKIIVAEHMLSERLARIQARPGHIAIYTGLVGIVGGAFLSASLQSNNNIECVCESKKGSSVQQEVEKSIQTKPAITTITDIPDKPATNTTKSDSNGQ